VHETNEVKKKISREKDFSIDPNLVDDVQGPKILQNQSKDYTSQS